MGRYEPLLIDPYEQANDDSNILTLKDKFSKLVLSATDTEMTHVTLHDLLPDNKYFRFNPYLSGKFWKIHFSYRKPVGYIVNGSVFFRNNFYGWNASWKDQCDAEWLPNVLSSQCEKAGLGVKVDNSPANISSKRPKKVERVRGELQLQLFDSSSLGKVNFIGFQNDFSFKFILYQFI